VKGSRQFDELPSLTVVHGKYWVFNSRNLEGCHRDCVNTFFLMVSPTNAPLTSLPSLPSLSLSIQQQQQQQQQLTSLSSLPSLPSVSSSSSNNSNNSSLSPLSPLSPQYPAAAATTTTHPFGSTSCCPREPRRPHACLVFVPRARVDHGTQPLGVKTFSVYASPICSVLASKSPQFTEAWRKFWGDLRKPHTHPGINSKDPLPNLDQLSLNNTTHFQRCVFRKAGFGWVRLGTEMGLGGKRTCCGVAMWAFYASDPLNLHHSPAVTPLANRHCRSCHRQRAYSRRL
jgi:hypothetical protein